MTETNYISKQLDLMTNFAQQNDVLFILMAHPTKPQRNAGKELTPTLYDISGSANFFNKTDFGIVVERDFEKSLVNIHIQKVRFKHLGKVGNAIFKYNLDNGRYTPYKDGEPTIFDNTNHLHENKMLGESSETERDNPFETNNNLPF